MTDHLITPHGGRLVDLLVDDERAEELRKQSRDWPSWNLTARQLCDLELLANGGFSPLTGFLGRADYEAVCERMRLADGTLWPIPVVLDVPEEVAATLEPGAPLALRDDEKRHDEPLRRAALFHRCNNERTQNPHADECGDAADTRNDGQRQLPPPRPDEMRECRERVAPSDMGCIGADVARCDPVFIALHAAAPRSAIAILRCIEHGLRIRTGHIRFDRCLRAHQTPIRSVHEHQRVVAAAFDHTSAVEHENAVGADHAEQGRREPDEEQHGQDGSAQRGADGVGFRARGFVLLHWNQ